MQTIDRKTGPKIRSDYKFEIPKFKETKLDNGLVVLEVNSGTQEIVKIDVVFKVGRINEIKRASSKAAFSLLREGTLSRSSEALAYNLDYFGAVLNILPGIEYSSVSLVSMDRHFEKTWPILLDILQFPSYSEAELKKYKNVTSQKLVNQISKNDVIAYRSVTELIFGDNHPYGYNTLPEDITGLLRKDILDFFDLNVGFNNTFVVISGKYDDTLRNQVLNDLSALSKKSEPIRANFSAIVPKNDFVQIPTKNQAQTSIKMGRRLFGRAHNDYSTMQFLNIVLGGYFGSRLMKNIREDKGYTYGIYSSVDIWKHDGFFYISAEVGNNAIDLTIKEINKEIKLLKTQLIPEEEFLMVKNFMLGQVLHLIDGPFATGQLIKNIYAKDLEIEHFKKHIKKIQTMSREDVIQVARQYLDENNFTTVLAGNF